MTFSKYAPNPQCLSQLPRNSYPTPQQEEPTAMSRASKRTLHLRRAGAISGARKRRRLNDGESLGESLGDRGSLGGNCESLGDAEPEVHQIPAAGREALEEELGEQESAR
ncbi:hypothetical protein FN846DRAFT_886422 [Sphaerosporella brunnea]|uniref:Uncharacterized protein n=1 Tax=Sphaerosporella brunnea TaxID=1250544 RepID=A0A5J5F9L0_9PEZI|nr:hypothetical protein FN846DRAFT_886422 [Sphaerosporella brunnea]